MLEPRPIQRIRRVYRFKGLKLIGVVLALVVLLQLVVMLGQTLFPRQIRAESGYVSHEFPVNMLVLRNETVICSPMAGRANLAVSAGSRVRRDDLLFEIIDPRYEKRLDARKRQELVEYWRCIAAIDRVLRGIEREISIYQSKSSGIGRRAIKAKDKADMEREILRLRSEAFRLKQRKNSIIDSARYREIAEYAPHYRCIFADEAGFFWPALDGGEKLPAGESYVPNLDDFERDYSAVSPVLEKEVQKEQPLGKLITNWEATLVAAVKETTYRPKEMQHCRLTLADGNELHLEFIQKLSAPEGEFWFFREASLHQELLKKRKIRGLLETRRTFGTRVPATSLKKVGKGWFVIISKRGKRFETPVQVVDADGSWAIVKGVNEGAIVLYR